MAELGGMAELSGGTSLHKEQLLGANLDSDGREEGGFLLPPMLCTPVRFEPAGPDVDRPLSSPPRAGLGKTSAF